MTWPLSQRIQSFKPSATVSISNLASQMRADGKDVINLAVGEPDFDTPAQVIDAAISAMQSGQTRYTHVAGTITLRQAICDKYQRENQLTYHPDQILVSNGAKQSIYNLTVALVEAGDEVIIPAPYWVSYSAMVAMAGAESVIIPCHASQNFKLTATQLSAAITPVTKLLILNSPNNPSGQAYSRAEWLAIGEVLRLHPQVMILSDDIYEHIYWGQEPLVNLLNVCPDLANRCVLVNGVSKAYAMTGWRIGYAAGPKEIISAMTKAQVESSSCASSISQAAALAALEGPQEFLQPMLGAYQQRHDDTVKRLSAMSGLKVIASQGTFYSFVDCSAAITQLGYANDLSLVKDILTHTGVALVPGEAFGLPNHFRLSYAADSAILQQACERLEKFFNR
ncbi:MAG: pyridoxal phosphate-dependent aminotransferase [Gammaproteobacteria bacterium]|nr:pyridoxal phosphate-dependent aminotransferase [Gammaproteobacteria bacterium]